MKFKMITEVNQEREKINNGGYNIKELNLNEEELKIILKTKLVTIMKNTDDPDTNGKSPDKYIDNLFANKLGEIDKRIIVVCEKNESIEGMLISLPDREHDNTYHIFTLGVNEEYRRKGIGKNILLYYFDLLKRADVKYAILDVHQNNKKAIKLYTSMNFKIMN